MLIFNIIHNISRSEAISLLENSVLEDRGYIQKNIVLNLGFAIHKIVDNMDIYKSLNISTGTVMRNPEMLKFVSDHLKTKQMCKHAVQHLPFVI